MKDWHKVNCGGKYTNINIIQFLQTSTACRYTWAQLIIKHLHYWLFSLITQSFQCPSGFHLCLSNGRSILAFLPVTNLTAQKSLNVSQQSHCCRHPPWKHKCTCRVVPSYTPSALCAWGSWTNFANQLRQVDGCISAAPWRLRLIRDASAYLRGRQNFDIWGSCHPF